MEEDRKPPYAIYLLESEWVWDHNNIEWATITIEGVEGRRYEKEYEAFMDKTCPDTMKELLISDLIKLAEAQNKCPMGDKARLKCLYRVVGFKGILHGTTPNQKPDANGQYHLSLTLKPICRFDEKNKPIPIQDASLIVRRG